jgi:DNA-binding LacI/PurR family transcriptional regulator
LDLPYNPHWVQFLQLPDVEPGILAGFHAMQAMIAGGSLPTALLATNDLVAMGVMEALKLAGLDVPGDVSVIGYDDLGRDGNPPLTTIRSYPEEVGRIAARMLIDQLEGQPSSNRVAVRAELVVRGSTAPPKPEVLP